MEREVKLGIENSKLGLPYGIPSIFIDIILISICPFQRCQLSLCFYQKLVVFIHTLQHFYNNFLLKRTIKNDFSFLKVSVSYTTLEIGILMDLITLETTKIFTCTCFLCSNCESYTFFNSCVKHFRNVKLKTKNL